MSLTSPLALDDAAGNSRTFQRLSTVAGGSDWIRTDTNLAEPCRLAIKHSQSGSGQNVVDRHLVQVTMTRIDGAGIARTAVVNLTIQFPRSSAISEANVNDLVAHACNLVTDNQMSSGIATTTNLEDLYIGVM